MIAPPKVASPTAIPIHFRKPRPLSWSARSSPQTSPSGPDDSPVSGPRPRPRPTSTEFRTSSEFRPLWLVERHSFRQPKLEEEYPPLPESRSVSETASLVDSDENPFIADKATDVPGETAGLGISSGINEALHTLPTEKSGTSTQVAAPDNPVHEVAQHQATSLSPPSSPSRIVHSVKDLFPDHKPVSHRSHDTTKTTDFPSIPLDRPKSPTHNSLNPEPKPVSSGVDPVTVGAILASAATAAVTAFTPENDNSQDLNTPIEESGHRDISQDLPSGMTESTEPVARPQEPEQPSSSRASLKGYEKKAKKQAKDDQSSIQESTPTYAEEPLQDSESQRDIDQVSKAGEPTSIGGFATTEIEEPVLSKSASKKTKKGKKRGSTISLDLAQPTTLDDSALSNLEAARDVNQEVNPIEELHDPELGAAEPDRPVLSRSTSRKEKTKKKSKANSPSVPDIVPVAYETETGKDISTPGILSPEQQKQLQEQDAQDAVDSWFDPPSPTTFRKSKKGKKKGQSVSTFEAPSPVPVYDTPTPAPDNTATADIGEPAPSANAPLTAPQPDRQVTRQAETRGSDFSPSLELAKLNIMTSPTEQPMSQVSEVLVSPLTHRDSESMSMEQQMPAVENEWQEFTAKPKKGKGKKKSASEAGSSLPAMYPAEQVLTTGESRGIPEADPEFVAAAEETSQRKGEAIVDTVSQPEAPMARSEHTTTPAALFTVPEADPGSVQAADVAFQSKTEDIRVALTSSVPGSPAVEPEPDLDLPRGLPKSNEDFAATANQTSPDSTEDIAQSVTIPEIAGPQRDPDPEAIHLDGDQSLAHDVAGSPEEPSQQIPESPSKPEPPLEVVQPLGEATPIETAFTPEFVDAAQNKSAQDSKEVTAALDKHAKTLPEERTTKAKDVTPLGSTYDDRFVEAAEAASQVNLEGVRESLNEHAAPILSDNQPMSSRIHDNVELSNDSAMAAQAASDSQNNEVQEALEEQAKPRLQFSEHAKVSTSTDSKPTPAVSPNEHSEQVEYEESSMRMPAQTTPPIQEKPIDLPQLNPDFQSGAEHASERGTDDALSSLNEVAEAEEPVGPVLGPMDIGAISVPEQNKAHDVHPVQESVLLKGDRSTRDSLAIDKVLTPIDAESEPRSMLPSKKKSKGKKKQIAEMPVESSFEALLEPAIQELPDSSTQTPAAVELELEPGSEFSQPSRKKPKGKKSRKQVSWSEPPPDASIETLTQNTEETPADIVASVERSLQSQKAPTSDDWTETDIQQMPVTQPPTIEEPPIVADPEDEFQVPSKKKSKGKKKRGEASFPEPAPEAVPRMTPESIEEPVSGIEDDVARSLESQKTPTDDDWAEPITKQPKIISQATPTENTAATADPEEEFQMPGKKKSKGKKNQSQVMWDEPAAEAEAVTEETAPIREVSHIGIDREVERSIEAQKTPTGNDRAASMITPDEQAATTQEALVAADPEEEFQIPGKKKSKGKKKRKEATSVEAVSRLPLEETTRDAVVEKADAQIGRASQEFPIIPGGAMPERILEPSQPSIVKQPLVDESEHLPQAANLEAAADKEVERAVQEFPPVQRSQDFEKSQEASQPSVKENTEKPLPEGSEYEQIPTSSKNKAKDKKKRNQASSGDPEPEVNIDLERQPELTLGQAESAAQEADMKITRALEEFPPVAAIQSVSTEHVPTITETPVSKAESQRAEPNVQRAMEQFPPVATVQDAEPVFDFSVPKKKKGKKGKRAQGGSESPLPEVVEVSQDTSEPNNENKDWTVSNDLPTRRVISEPKAVIDTTEREALPSMTQENGTTPIRKEASLEKITSHSSSSQIEGPNFDTFADTVPLPEIDDHDFEEPQNERVAEKISEPVGLVERPSMPEELYVALPRQDKLASSDPVDVAPEPNRVEPDPPYPKATGTEKGLNHSIAIDETFAATHAWEGMSEPTQAVERLPTESKAEYVPLPVEGGTKPATSQDKIEDDDQVLEPPKPETAKDTSLDEPSPDLVPLPQGDDADLADFQDKLRVNDEQLAASLIGRETSVIETPKAATDEPQWAQKQSIDEPVSKALGVPHSTYAPALSLSPTSHAVQTKIALDTSPKSLPLPDFEAAQPIEEPLADKPTASGFLEEPRSTYEISPVEHDSDTNVRPEEISASVEQLENPATDEAEPQRLAEAGSLPVTLGNNACSKIAQPETQAVGDEFSFIPNKKKGKKGKKQKQPSFEPSTEHDNQDTPIALGTDHQATVRDTKPDNDDSLIRETLPAPTSDVLGLETVAPQQEAFTSHVDPTTEVEQEPWGFTTKKKGKKSKRHQQTALTPDFETPSVGEPESDKAEHLQETSRDEPVEEMSFPATIPPELTDVPSQPSLGELELGVNAPGAGADIWDLPNKKKGKKGKKNKQEQDVDLELSQPSADKPAAIIESEPPVETTTVGDLAQVNESLAGDEPQNPPSLQSQDQIASQDGAEELWALPASKKTKKGKLQRDISREQSTGTSTPANEVEPVLATATAASQLEPEEGIHRDVQDDTLYPRDGNPQGRITGAEEVWALPSTNKAKKGKKAKLQQESAFDESQNTDIPAVREDLPVESLAIENFVASPTLVTYKDTLQDLPASQIEQQEAFKADTEEAWELPTTNKGKKGKKGKVQQEEPGPDTGSVTPATENQPEVELARDPFVERSQSPGLLKRDVLSNLPDTPAEDAERLGTDPDDLWAQPTPRKGKKGKKGRQQQDVGSGTATPEAPSAKSGLPEFVAGTTLPEIEPEFSVKKSKKDKKKAKKLPFADLVNDVEETESSGVQPAPSGEIPREASPGIEQQKDSPFEDTLADAPVATTPVAELSDQVYQSLPQLTIEQAQETYEAPSDTAVDEPISTSQTDIYQVVPEASITSTNTAMNKGLQEFEPQENDPEISRNLLEKHVSFPEVDIATAIPSVEIFPKPAFEPHHGADNILPTRENQPYVSSPLPEESGYLEHTEPMQPSEAPIISETTEEDRSLVADTLPEFNVKKRKKDKKKAKKAQVADADWNVTTPKVYNAQAVEEGAAPPTEDSTIPATESDRNPFADEDTNEAAIYEATLARALAEPGPSLERPEERVGSAQGAAGDCVDNPAKDRPNTPQNQGTRPGPDSSSSIQEQGELDVPEEVIIQVDEPEHSRGYVDPTISEVPLHEPRARTDEAAVPSEAIQTDEPGNRDRFVDFVAPEVPLEEPRDHTDKLTAPSGQVGQVMGTDEQPRDISHGSAIVDDTQGSAKPISLGDEEFSGFTTKKKSKKSKKSKEQATEQEPTGAINLEPETTRQEVPTGLDEESNPFFKTEVTRNSQLPGVLQEEAIVEQPEPVPSEEGPGQATVQLLQPQSPEPGIDEEIDEEAGGYGKKKKGKKSKKRQDRLPREEEGLIGGTTLEPMGESQLVAEPDLEHPLGRARKPSPQVAPAPVQEPEIDIESDEEAGGFSKKKGKKSKQRQERLPRDDEGLIRGATLQPISQSQPLIESDLGSPLEQVREPSPQVAPAPVPEPEIDVESDVEAGGYSINKKGKKLKKKNRQAVTDTVADEPKVDIVLPNVSKEIYQSDTGALPNVQEQSMELPSSLSPLPPSLGDSFAPPPTSEPAIASVQDSQDDFGSYVTKKGKKAKKGKKQLQDPVTELEEPKEVVVDMPPVPEAEGTVSDLSGLEPTLELAKTQLEPIAAGLRAPEDEDVGSVTKKGKKVKKGKKEQRDTVTEFEEPKEVVVDMPPVPEAEGTTSSFSGVVPVLEPVTIQPEPTVAGLREPQDEFVSSVTNKGKKAKKGKKQHQETVTDFEEPKEAVVEISPAPGAHGTTSNFSGVEPALKPATIQPEEIATADEAPRESFEAPIYPKEQKLPDVDDFSSFTTKKKGKKGKSSRKQSQASTPVPEAESALPATDRDLEGISSFQSGPQAEVASTAEASKTERPEMEAKLTAEPLSLLSNEPVQQVSEAVSTDPKPPNLATPEQQSPVASMFPGLKRVSAKPPPRRPSVSETVHKRSLSLSGASAVSDKKKLFDNPVDVESNQADPFEGIEPKQHDLHRLGMHRLSGNTFPEPTTEPTPTTRDTESFVQSIDQTPERALSDDITRPSVNEPYAPTELSEEAPQSFEDMTAVRQADDRNIAKSLAPAAAVATLGVAALVGGEKSKKSRAETKKSKKQKKSSKAMDVQEDDVSQSNTPQHFAPLDGDDRHPTRLATTRSKTTLPEPELTSPKTTSLETDPFDPVHPEPETSESLRNLLRSPKLNSRGSDAALPQAEESRYADDMDISDFEPSKSLSEGLQSSDHDSKPVQNRDSALHVADSPMLSSAIPARNVVRDSGFHDAGGSPVVRQSLEGSPPSRAITPQAGHSARQVSPHTQFRTSSTPIREESSASLNTLHPSATNTSSSDECGLNISVEVDPSYELSVSRHHQPHPEQQSSNESDRSLGFQLQPQDSISDSTPSEQPRGRRITPARSMEDFPQPSPVESTTRDRDSMLFDSSPAFPEQTHQHAEGIIAHSPAGHGKHDAHGEIYSGPEREEPASRKKRERSSSRDKSSLAPQEQQPSLFGGPLGVNSDRPLAQTPTRGTSGHRRSDGGLNTITEQSPEESPLHRKKSRTRSDVGSPPHALKAARRMATPQKVSHDKATQPSGLTPSTEPRPTTRDKKFISTDELISRLSWPSVDENEHTVDIERVKSRDTDRRSSSRQSVSPAITGDPLKPREVDRRSTSGQSVRSTGSAKQYRTPEREQIRSASGLSNRSGGTPPLRRVTPVSGGGDLRAANKRSQAKLAKDFKPELELDPLESSSAIYDPVTDKGKGRARDMADVYVSLIFI